MQQCVLKGFWISVFEFGTGRETATKDSYNKLRSSKVRKFGFQILGGILAVLVSIHG